MRVGTAAKEEFHHSWIWYGDGGVQGAPAKGKGVNVGSVVKEKFDDLCPLGADGHVEWTRSIPSVE